VSKNLVKIWLDCVAQFQNLVGLVLAGSGSNFFGQNLVKIWLEKIWAKIWETVWAGLFEHLFDYNELVTKPKNA